MKLVDIEVSNTSAGNSVRVRVPPAAPIEKEKAGLLAYIVGVSLGDGNLSRPNGRTTRLRITCDNKYPRLGKQIQEALKMLLPTNRVSIIKRTDSRCFDISVYSNKLDEWLPWRVGHGSKIVQQATIPNWIQSNPIYAKACLRGLIQTDGCIYTDRGYKMVNFTNNNQLLAEDFKSLVIDLGFKPSHNNRILGNNRSKHTIRIARNAEKFINLLKLYKA